MASINKNISYKEAAKDSTVICNRCNNGYPISNQFKESCPEGWTLDKNPCKDIDKAPNNEKL